MKKNEDQPIYAQISTDNALKSNRLEHPAQLLPEVHITAGRPRTRPTLLKRLQQQEALLRAAYQYLANTSEVQFAFLPVAEWILDNYFLLQQTCRQISEDMPPGFYRQLPKFDAGLLAGYPRIYGISQKLIGICQAQLDMDRVKRFVHHYQNIVPLTTGELWALPVMLRLGLVEFLVQTISRNLHLPRGNPLPVMKLHHPLTDDEIVANAITSLWTLATQNWQAFFESVSLVEQILRQDPVGVYSHLDFDTRNRYRGVIEGVALAAGQDEGAVARNAISLAREEFARDKEADKTREPSRTAHVGYYFLDVEGRARLEACLGYHPPWSVRLFHWLRRRAIVWYLGGIASLSLLGLFSLVSYAFAAGGTLIQLIAVLLLAALPTLAIAVDLVNWLVTHIVPPQPLPRLDFQEEGVPAEYCAMVVIPALLSTERDAPFLTHQLESHFLGNEDPNIHFALLTDFADAPQKEMLNDSQLVEQAQTAIERLNEKYGKNGYRPFYLFHRERAWNTGEACWMGWERKRGKLEEFNNLLRGSDSTTYTVRLGDLSILPNVRYVITLDADTQLPRESAHRLIGALAHPLNRAEFDPVSGKIKAGYTILQPRVQVKPVVANQSLFTRVYSGDSVIDLYTRAVSDVYQDLFGEGNYVGKGIYDVDAFQRSVQNHIPENQLLSHDLFEGLQGRCGLVTDVVLFEDYPPHYLAYADRLHRWVRGDWQLLPWLGTLVPHRTQGRVPNPLSLIDRWKIMDNLRRSLLPIMAIILFAAGWLLLPGASIIWITLALSPFLVSMVINLISGLLNNKTGRPSHMIMQPLRLSALRSLFEIIFLPHESVVMLDAIVTTLARMFITHKRMLQWMTAAHTVQLFGNRVKVKVAWQEMVIAPMSAFALFLLLLAFHPQSLLFASPFLIAWIIAPYIAARIGQPEAHPVKRLLPAQERKLHLLARSTWLYFEHFVGPADRWLPPDHFQESPRGMVAHRTSPTNIGLMLLSTLSAHDFGYIGSVELLLRLRNTFDSMESLERMRGHFLNWYDTRTFAPLSPRYISTVDSGNLAACLLILCQGCNEMDQSPVVYWEGLLDTVSVLSHTLEQAHLGNALDDLHGKIDSLYAQVKTLSDTSRFSPSLLARLFNNNYAEMENLLVEAAQKSGEDLAPDVLRDLSVWTERVRHHLKQIESDLRMLAPWLLTISATPRLFSQPNLKPEIESAKMFLLETLSTCPSLGQIPEVCRQAGMILKRIMDLLDESDQDTRDWCQSLAHEIESAWNNSELLLHDYSVLASKAESFFQAMNFNFLFNPLLRVFHLGYHIDADRPDVYHYGLLASESRITSLLAIAKGDVPQSHWLYLGRPLTLIDGVRTLLSWTGTMFEYLMPSLLMRRYEGTLLDQSDQAAVERQIAYARQKGVPWGISESAYYHFDAAMNYQYGPFGVPGLGIRPRLDWETVIAPYASLLALPLRPQAVMQNLEWFEKHKLWGLYGLYESVDFTAGHLKIGEDFAIIRSFMVHHQGMILLSLCNYLFNKPMVRRFHADPRIESAELLLQEQTPLHAPTERPSPLQMDTNRGTYTAVPFSAWRVSPDAPYTQLHCLSNGSYNLLITAAGGGFSRWRETDLTRWRADTTLDNFGAWLYIRDRQTNQLWSASFQPTAVQPATQDVRFHPHTVEFSRRDGDISTRLRIAIAPNADVEIRRLTVNNQGEYPRDLTLTSYAEVILAPQPVEQRHPAYNKLFIESEYIADGNILLFHRRPRSAQDKPIYLAHFAVDGRDDLQITGYETDRASFLGRGGTPRAPAALQTSSKLSNTSATLDPIFALQANVVVPGYGSCQLAFVTLAAASRKEALDLAHRYRQWHQINRAFADSRTQAEQELIQIGLTSRQLEQVQKLLSVLLYPAVALRSDPATLAANTLGQSGLWPFSISGDYPILLVYIKEKEDLDLLNELIQAHTYWRRRGLMIDLVLLNRRETSYDQDFQRKIYRLLNRTNSDDRLGKRGGIFVLREDQMSEAERVLLATTARVVLDGKEGSLAHQLEKLDRLPVRLPHFVSTLPPPSEVAATSPLERPSSLLFDNGLGGFTPNGREYVIYLDRGQWAPTPWINVIANPEFGFLVSEAGMGCTWAINSRENRLTPWHNDPVSDPPSEAIYLRDEDTGQIWSPTPLPARADAPYLIRHGIGYSIFEHRSHDLDQHLRLFAIPDAPVKIAQLKMKNTSTRTRRINVTYYADWVLGATHEEMAQYIVPEYDSTRFALLAHNPYNQDFGQRVAFLAATRELQGLTTDRVEFLGLLGSYAHPEALERVGLTANAQAGTDPSAAMQLLLWLAPGETKEVTFLLGQGADHADALKLISHYQNLLHIQAAWESLDQFWDDKIGGIQIKTPDPAMDLLINRWLPYQTLACRIWGRTAFYQSSGAFGFRDQLQDVLSFMYTSPEITRKHILLAAGHQFEQGDVLHWWHPPAARGIRTRITDNLLWLPYVTAQYIKVTDDRSILDEPISFLSAEPLKEGEHERYGEFPTGTVATLYEHCRRALDKGTTSGPHGLPLMGEGDWNDGMNNVGIGGTGESIWLGWFLYSTLTSFAGVCDLITDAEQASLYRQQAETLIAALEAHGWDGNWYRRAYYDDGKPLGSVENRDCQIDSISQSWAVISGAANPERARIAMESLDARLVHRDDGLILLLTPPFDHTLHDPGYIRGYLPGIRENGGQYTHAALWAIWAFAVLGEGDHTAELFRLINPIHHSDTPEKILRYRAEPYVVAADVYSAWPYVGRGGWTWYTGSAGWMYRLGVEKILGLQREGDHLKIESCIPKTWHEYEIHYRFGGAIYHIHVENPLGVNGGVMQLSLDGELLDGKIVALANDGREHTINVTLG